MPLFPGPLKPRVVEPVWVSFISQIDLFKNDLYLIGPYEKKKKQLSNNYTKNYYCVQTSELWFV